MISRPFHRCAVRAALAAPLAGILVLAAPLAGRAAAAENSEFGLISGFLPGPTSDSAMTLIAPRDPDAIKADLAAMRDLSSAAERASRRAKSLGIQAKAEVDQRKSEIDAIKEEEKRAKDENRDADKDAIQARRKSKELILDLYKGYQDVRDEEKDLADAREELAEARIRFHEKELQLASRRAAMREALAKPGSDLSAASEAEAEAEAVALSLLKEVAGKESAVAKNGENMVDRMSKVRDLRLDILKAGAK